MDIAGKIALVTGGASGLGRATVDQLVQLGAQVVVIDLPTSGGEALVKESDGQITFVPGDVTNESHAEEAVHTAAGLGELAVVVNCAGTGAPERVIGRDGAQPLASFARIVNINLIGTFNVLRVAAATMAAQESSDEDRGLIVNTASVAAFDGQIGQAAYSASKAGVVGMTLPIARELARHRIRVVTIAPGLFRTPLFSTLSDDVIAALSSSVPHPNRLGKPEEYAQLVASIVGNPYLNGETIRLDGAIRMAAK
ncbi:SDR family NAD(P)-dependent oxidoreductase [Streptomyces sp. NPDC101225]|uniref:SDR family NAD(P)-dependent oxidoreductase n=1 Tax=Streptomyces sp. NPDC101225 TaxID=3366135 RepID=UPI003825528D